MSTVGRCVTCGALTPTQPNRDPLCAPCVPHRARDLARRATAALQANQPAPLPKATVNRAGIKPGECVQCGHPIPRHRYKNATRCGSRRCERAHSRELYEQRQLLKLQAEAEAPDTPEDVALINPWEFYQRLKSTGGEWFARRALEELSKHRRVKGEPEVRI